MPVFPGYKALYIKATTGTSTVAQSRQASRGRCEARRGMRPEDPPRAADRKRRAWAQALVGSAGYARYSGRVSWGHLQRGPGPRGLGQAGWYRESLELPSLRWSVAPPTGGGSFL